MNRIIKIFFVLLLCFTCLSPLEVNAASANHKNVGLSTEEISTLMKKYDIHSCSITYSMNKKIIFSQGFGYEDIFSNHKVDEKSVFEAGSNGKMIAAYICLKLANQGKIDLDDSIIKYLKKDWVTTDNRFSKITIAQLLSHTAGFSPSYELGMDKNIYFDPGSQFSYSGVGYMYLQQIIENVTNLSFNEAAKEYVFKPLHMNSSTFSTAKSVTPFIKTSSLTIYAFTVFVAGMLAIISLGFLIGFMTKFKYFSRKTIFYISLASATALNAIFILILMSKLIMLFAIFIIIALVVLFSTRKKGKWNYIAFVIYTVAVIILGLTIPISLPAGSDIITNEPNCAYSLKSTSSDLSLFSNELLNCYQDEKGSFKRVFNSEIKIDKNNSWGLGIAIEKEASDTTYWDSGINPGFQSLVIINPQQKVSVVVLTNSDDGLDFSKEIARKFLNIDGTWEIKRTELKKK